MPVINITKKMLEAGKPWGPGQFKATLVEVKEAPSKNKDSINYKPVFVRGWKSDGSLEDGNQLSEFAYLMNSKNSAMFAKNVIPFVSACMDKIIDEPTSVDFDKLKGSEVYVQIEPETYNGNINDKIIAFFRKSAPPF
jgi:hypothetical protein